MRDKFDCDCLNPDGYMTTVDRAKTRDEMLLAGDYRDAPMLMPGQFETTSAGKKVVRLALVHLHEDATFEEARDALLRRGEKLAGATELLALGAEHPKLQTRRPIVELGDIDGPADCPEWVTALALTFDDGARRVEEAYLENGVKAGTHVLVIKE
jgi:hypothetical protein